MTIRTNPMDYPDHKTNHGQTSGLRHLLGAMKTAIGKHVTIDKDGIFKDPDWPHMWDHKR